jgi:hypothetical protein
MSNLKIYVWSKTTFFCLGCFIVLLGDALDKAFQSADPGRDLIDAAVCVIGITFLLMSRKING